MKKRLGKLELRVMRLVWKRGKATVRDIWTVLYPERGLAYTTVATVMRQLEGKGFLKHIEKERTYVYYPLVDQESVSQGLLGELIDGLFDGSAASLVITLVRGDQISEEDLEDIQRIILEHQTAGGDENG